MVCAVCSTMFILKCEEMLSTYFTCLGSLDNLDDLDNLYDFSGFMCYFNKYSIWLYT